MKLLVVLLIGLASFQSTPVEANLRRGMFLMGRGRFVEAEAPLRKAVEVAADDARAWNLLGRSLHLQKKWDEVLVVYEKLGTFPRFLATAHYNSACVHSLLGQKDEAFASLKLAVAAGFQNPSLVSSDSELDNLRNDPRFLQILPPFRIGAEAFVEETRVIHSIDGEGAGDEFGFVARSVGDMDGDGVTDFAATAPGKQIGGRHAGRVYVYSGRTAKLLFQVDGKPGWRLGSCVSGRFDVNGDGRLDIVVGAPASGAGHGRACVVDGSNGVVLYELSMGEAGDRFGVKTSGIEDLDGDGCSEIVVGASRADANGKDSGCIYIFSGKAGELLYKIPGENAGDRLGMGVDATLGGGHKLLIGGAPGAAGGGLAVAYRCTDKGASRAFDIQPDATSKNLGYYFVTVIGDVDGDGTPDCFATDFNNGANGPNTGRIFVHSGKSGKRLLTVTGHAAGEGFGTSASYCGDVNGDGSADMIVGAWQNASVSRSAGAVYLHSGKDGELLAQWSSAQGGDTLGFDAVGLGDVDGDGAHDFLLTSAWSCVKGPKTGRIWVVAGPRLTAKKPAGGR